MTKDIIVWNTHDRISKEAAEAHIAELTSKSPAPVIETPYAKASSAPDDRAYDDLDTPDELAIRSLLLGIIHKSIREFDISRAFLEDALKLYSEVEAKWIGGIASFELGVLELKEAEFQDKKSATSVQTEEHAIPTSASLLMWQDALRVASERLDRASEMSGANVDLSSRLDSRIAMLRDEIALKQAKLGLSG